MVTKNIIYLFYTLFHEKIYFLKNKKKIIFSNNF